MKEEAGVAVARIKTRNDLAIAREIIGVIYALSSCSLGC